MIEINIHLRLSKRRLAIQIGVLLTLLLIPVWYRLPDVPPLLPALYVSRFLLLLPMLFTVAAWMLAGFPGIDAFRRDVSRVVWVGALAMLAVWMYASGAWAFMANREPELALNAAFQMGVVVLFVFAMVCAGPPPRAVIAVLTFGLLWNVLIAGAQVAAQSDIGLGAIGEFTLGVNQSGVSVIQSGELRWLRPYGLLPHPNILAAFMSVSLLMLVYWLIDVRGWVLALALMGVVVGGWVFLLTFSRGSWLGFAAGAFALLPVLVRLRRVNAGLVLGVLCLFMVGIAFFITYQPLILARAGVGLEGTEVLSIAERTIFTQTAFRAILDNPILGVGAGNFPWRASYYLFEADFPLRGDNVHHALTSIWAETGIIGFALTITAMIAGVECGLRRIRAGEGDSAGRAVLLAGFIALGVIGLFEHSPYTLPQIQVLWWGILAAATQPHFEG